MIPVDKRQGRVKIQIFTKKMSNYARKMSNYARDIDFKKNSVRITVSEIFIAG